MILIIAGIIVVIIILAIFGWIYLRKRERDPPLLSREGFEQVA